MYAVLAGMARHISTCLPLGVHYRLLEVQYLDSNLHEDMICALWPLSRYETGLQLWDMICALWPSSAFAITLSESGIESLAPTSE